MRILLYWLFVIAVFICGTLNIHVPATATYSPSAAIFVFGALPILLFCRLGFQGSLDFGKRLFSMSPNEHDHRTVDLLNASAFFFSGIGVIVGMIHVMRNLANLDAVGPGMAIAFVSVLYGALVPILLLPFNDSIGAKRLVKQGAVFAFLIAPGMTGITLFSMNLMKVL